jgi:ATP-binding cassette, subfamily C (CFTR/MRP), member 2
VLAFFWIQSYYIRTARTLKLFAVQTGSEIFSHLSESLYGIGVIRAFDAEERFIRKNCDNVDENHMCM